MAMEMAFFFTICLLAMLVVLTGSLLLVKIANQQKKGEKLQQIHLETLDKLHDVVINSHLFTKGLVKQVTQLEKKLEALMAQQEKIEDNLQSDSAYKQASKLVEMGASIEDIMSSCDLSRAEAELVLNLHRQKNMVTA